MKMCALLGVSRSGYYSYLQRKKQEPSDLEKKKAALEKKISQIFHESYGTYGSPRVHAQLIREGWIVSQKTVANRMRELNLVARMPRKRVMTTDSNHRNRVYPNTLNRQFEPKQLNAAWAVDITYVMTLEGTLYFNPVIDLCSKRIITYQIDDQMKTELPKRALEEAIILRNPSEGLIHHSDRGTQYTSDAYLSVLERVEAVVSMSRKGNPYDNACAESFFSSFKQEFLYRKLPQTKAEARALIHEYVGFYNERRLHSTLGYLTPVEFEHMKRSEAISE